MPNRSVLTFSLQLKTSLQGVQALIKRLGYRTALKLAAELSLQQTMGAPFRHLPKAKSKRERLSRTQIGPAIILYKLLKKTNSQEDALEICRDIIVDGTILFLTKAIGPINPIVIAQMDQARRTQWVKERAEQFFNASLDWHEISDKGIAFTVTKCLFPELCLATNVPELAPLFCEGDKHYFSQPNQYIQFKRPYTIASGARTCPFTLGTPQHTQETSSPHSPKNTLA